MLKFIQHGQELVSEFRTSEIGIDFCELIIVKLLIYQASRALFVSGQAQQGLQGGFFSPSVTALTAIETAAVVPAASAPAVELYESVIKKLS